MIVNIEIYPTEFLVDISALPTVFNVEISQGGDGDGETLTAEQIKALYESNANTNAFTDNEKTKLAGLNNFDPTPKFSEIIMEAETDGIEIPITGGTYMVYNFRGQTVYRYITTATNANGYPTQDAFYSTFDGTTLSGLITTRG